jgi:hypothetical protein
VPHHHSGEGVVVPMAEEAGQQFSIGPPAPVPLGGGTKVLDDHAQGLERRRGTRLENMNLKTRIIESRPLSSPRVTACAPFGPYCNPHHLRTAVTIFELFLPYEEICSPTSPKAASTASDSGLPPHPRIADSQFSNRFFREVAGGVWATAGNSI